MEIVIKIEAEGGKKVIYELKDQIIQVLSNYSCHYDVTTQNDSGLVETTSVVQELRGIRVEDCIEAEIVEDQNLPTNPREGI